MRKIVDNIDPGLICVNTILDMWINPTEQKLMYNNVDFVVCVTSSKQMWKNVTTLIICRGVGVYVYVFPFVRLYSEFILGCGIYLFFGWTFC